MNEQNSRVSSRERRLRYWVLLLAFCFIGFPQIAAAQDDVLLQLEELKGRTELALYFAKASILASAKSDVLINVQAMLDVLDGISSERRIHLIEDVSTIKGAPEQSTPLLNIELTHAISSALTYIEMAQQAGQGAVDATDDIFLSELTHRTYAYLLAALGSDTSGFGMAGIRQVIEWLPNSTLNISSGESIQEAIDRVLPGGTVLLPSGTYYLSSSLRIGKSLTLSKEPLNNGEVLLIGPSEGASIYLGNDTPQTTCTIQLQDLSICGGEHGIVIGLSGDVRWGEDTKLTMARVQISGCAKSGLYVVNSTASLEDCVIQDNDQFGILIPLGGGVDMSRCLVAANGTQQLAATSYFQTSGIHALGRSFLSIQDSTISGNAGNGIHVGNHVQLNLMRSQVIANHANGLLVWDQASVHLQDNEFLSNVQEGIQFADPACQQDEISSVTHAFTGSVSGWGNLLSLGDDGSNSTICPLDDYRYLLDPPL